MSFEYISAKEAAAQIGVTERWVQQLCKDGKVDGARQFGAQGVWLVPLKWVATRTDGGTSAKTP